MKKLLTLVNFILDESGSMEEIKDSIVSGFNEYIQTLSKDQTVEYRFTLTKFSSSWGIKTPYLDTPLLEVSKMTDKDYEPDGGTPLYDAIGKTIKLVEEKVKKNQPVLVVIMTDGYENDSKEYSQAQIKLLIEAHKEDGWTFAFMGANQDSWLTSKGLGISRGNTMDWDSSTNESSVHALKSLAISNIVYAANIAGTHDSSLGRAVTTDNFFKQDDELDKTV